MARNTLLFEGRRSVIALWLFGTFVSWMGTGCLAGYLSISSFSQVSSGGHTHKCTHSNSFIGEIWPNGEENQGYSDPKMYCYMDFYENTYKVVVNGKKVYYNSQLKYWNEANPRVETYTSKGNGYDENPHKSLKSDYGHCKNCGSENVLRIPWETSEFSYDHIRNYLPKSVTCDNYFCGKWTYELVQVAFKVTVTGLSGSDKKFDIPPSFGDCEKIVTSDEQSNIKCPWPKFMMYMYCEGGKYGHVACQSWSKVCCQMCEPGYVGKKCDKPLPKRSTSGANLCSPSHTYYGTKARLNANEQYSVLPHGSPPLTCPCKPGWTGDTCHTCICDANRGFCDLVNGFCVSCRKFWELSSAKDCVCGCNRSNLAAGHIGRSNNNWCATDGSCRNGAGDTQFCVDEFWGPKCTNSATCVVANSRHGTNSVSGNCHLKSGTRCKPGFAGINCDIECSILGTRMISDGASCVCHNSFIGRNCASVDNNPSICTGPISVESTLCRAPMVYSPDGSKCIPVTSPGAVRNALDSIADGGCFRRRIFELEVSMLDTSWWTSVWDTSSDQYATLIELLSRTRTWLEWLKYYQACTSAEPSVLCSDPALKSIMSGVSDYFYPETFGVVSSRTYSAFQYLAAKLNNIPGFSLGGDLVVSNDQTSEKWKLLLEIGTLGRELGIKLGVESDEIVEVKPLWPDMLDNTFKYSGSLNLSAIDLGVNPYNIDETASTVARRFGLVTKQYASRPSSKDGNLALTAFLVGRLDSCKLCPCDRMWDGINRCVRYPDDFSAELIHASILQHVQTNIQCANKYPQMRSEYLRRAIECAKRVEIATELDTSNPYGLRVIASRLIQEVSDMASSIKSNNGYTVCEENENLESMHIESLQGILNSRRFVSGHAGGYQRLDLQSSIVMELGGLEWLEQTSARMIEYSEVELEKVGRKLRTTRSKRFSEWVDQTTREKNIKCDPDEEVSIAPLSEFVNWKSIVNDWYEGWNEKLQPLYLFNIEKSIAKQLNVIEAKHEMLESLEVADDNAKTMQSVSVAMSRILHSMFRAFRGVYSVVQPVLLGEKTAQSTFPAESMNAFQNVSSDATSTYSKLMNRVSNGCELCPLLFAHTVRDVYNELGYQTALNVAQVRLAFTTSEWSRSLLQYVSQPNCTSYTLLRGRCEEVKQKLELQATLNFEREYYTEASRDAAIVTMLSSMEARWLPIRIGELWMKNIRNIFSDDSQLREVSDAVLLLVDVSSSAMDALCDVFFALSGFTSPVVESNQPGGSSSGGAHTRIHRFDETMSRVLCLPPNADDGDESNEETVKDNVDCEPIRRLFHQIVRASGFALKEIVHLEVLMRMTLRYSFLKASVESSATEWRWWNKFMIGNLYTYNAATKSRGILIRELETSRSNALNFDVLEEMSYIAQHLCWTSFFTNPVTMSESHLPICRLNQKRLQRADFLRFDSRDTAKASSSLLNLQDGLQSSSGYARSTVAIDIWKYAGWMKDESFDDLHFFASHEDIQVGALCSLDGAVVLDVKTAFYDKNSNPITTDEEGNDILIETKWSIGAPWAKWTIAQTEVEEYEGFNEYHFEATQSGDSFVNGQPISVLEVRSIQNVAIPTPSLPLKNTAPFYGSWSAKFKYGNLKSEQLPSWLAEKAKRIVLFVEIAGVKHAGNPNVDCDAVAIRSSFFDANAATITAAGSVLFVVGAMYAVYKRRNRTSKSATKEVMKPPREILEKHGSMLTMNPKFKAS